VPPAPVLVVPAIFPGGFEVKVFNVEAGATLVAALELISPRKKDRPESRPAVATKCASHLPGAISLILVDIVTRPHPNLHNEIMHLMELGEALQLPQDANLYAVAYRPVRRNQVDQIEMWPSALAIGQPLPELPLALSGELCVPVDLEGTYAELCRRRRL